MDNQVTEWHSVRPWHPTLSLSVREITSVSVTFVLSSPYSIHDAAIPAPSLASLGLSSSDDDEHSRDSISTVDTDQGQIVNDIVVKGLSVKVNGTPWQRFICKADDVLDEAIIIVHGLMPARQYDVELGIVPGEPTVRGQITTDHEVRSVITLPDRADDSSANTPDGSISLSSSPSHANSLAHSPSAHGPPFTLEDRHHQLTHTLSILTAEHANLTSSLKSARRESQKADAALRAEIDTLKRASERYAAGESRARKKVLALQEAVKQTLAAAKDIDALIRDIEDRLPALEERKVEVEREWKCVREEAKQARARREEAEGSERVRAEAAQAELASMMNRLEKLNGKKEKLEGEGGAIAELEERLRRLEEERERVEKDPYGYVGEADADGEDASASSRTTGDRTKDDNSPESEKAPHAPAHRHNHGNNSNDNGGQHPHNNFHPQQHPIHPRKRHSHPHMPHHPHQHHHPRPSFPPGRSFVHQNQQYSQDQSPHRPAGSRASFPAPNHHPVPGVIHLQPHGHPHKGHNHGRGFRAQQVQAHGQGQGSSGSSVSSTPVTNTSSNAGPSGSTLSSRAPPFEPGRPRGHSHPQTQQVQAAAAAAAAAAAKSDLNPGSTPFAPRSSVVQAVASTVGAGVSGRTVPGP